MWGRFSDRYGRRPALMVGMTASAIAYVDLRVLGHALAAVPVAPRAGVGRRNGERDPGVRRRRAQAGGAREGRSAGCRRRPTPASPSARCSGRRCVVLGPHAPGLAAAALCVLNIGFRVALPGRVARHGRSRASNVHKRGRSRRRGAGDVLTHSSEPAPRLIWIYAIGIGAFQGMNAILALFLAARFGVTSHTIGYFYTYIGVISVLTRALILGWAVDRFGEARLSRLGQMLLAIGLATMPFMHRMQRSGGVRGEAGRDSSGLGRSVAAVPAARTGGRAAAARHGVHLSVRHGAALARHSEQRARSVHGRAADVRRDGAGALSDSGRIRVRPVPGSCHFSFQPPWWPARFFLGWVWRNTPAQSANLSPRRRLSRHRVRHQVANSLGGRSMFASSTRAVSLFMAGAVVAGAACGGSELDRHRLEFAVGM